jgi:isoamylase
MRWSDITAKDQALTAFTRKLTALRAEHEIFRRASFRDGCVISWLNPTGGDQAEEHWDDAGARTIGMMLRCESCEGAKLAVALFNSFDGDIEFALPDHPDGKNWRCLIDTAADEASDGAAAREYEGISPYPLAARSMAVLA